MNTQSAAFYLRTAPLIDKNFKLRYAHQDDVKSSREVALGLKKYDRTHEAIDNYGESESFVKSKRRIY